MSAIRIVILSIVLAAVVIAAVSFIAPLPASSTPGARTAPKSSAIYAVVKFIAALPARAAQPASAICPGPAAVTNFSTAQLWQMLNARYERRVGLPR